MEYSPTYWNSRGKYENISTILDKGGIKKLTKSEQVLWSKKKKRYYRFFNDGDCHYTLKEQAKEYFKIKGVISDVQIAKYLDEDIDNFLKGIAVKYNIA